MLPSRSATWRRGASYLASALLAGALASACASYIHQSLALRPLVEQQRFDEALKGLEALDNGSSRLLYLYERGLVLHARGDYGGSNAALDRAEILIGDLYTKSLSREIGSLLTSDNLREYRGERFESAYLHYYRILNYLDLDKVEDAAVESRRLNQRLQRYQDQKGSFYRNDPFLQYLTGLVYEQAGERVDADVSLRAALAAYRTVGPKDGIEMPPDLPCELARNAEALGRRSEAEQYRAEYGCPGRAPGEHATGVVNLILECGYVDAKVEQNLVFPIYSGEVGEDLDESHFARMLVEERGDGRPQPDRRLDYLLRVAVPQMVDVQCSIQHVDVRAVADSGAAQAPARGDTLRPAGHVGAPGPFVRAATVQNLSVLANRAFEEARTEIMTRAVVRALAKYIAKKKADKEEVKEDGKKEKKNPLAGWLVQGLAFATEGADTRSWSLLPERILLARLELPPGRYRLDVRLLNANGQPAQNLSIPNVELQAGAVRLLNYRVN